MNGAHASFVEHALRPAKPAGHPRTLMLLRLGVRWFAVDVRTVEEVALKGEVTRVPRAPQHILGVTSLRGRLVTVVALAQLVPSEALSHEGAATLPRLVVIRHRDYEMALVAESIGGMIDHVSLGDSEAPGPTNPVVSEELVWHGNRVAVLDVPALIAAAARLAGILAPTDREEA